MYKVQIAKRLIDEEEGITRIRRSWLESEDDVVKTFGENSIQHLITVL
jgi:hypothetical protein